MAESDSRHGAALRFWPHLLAVAFLNVGYHRAQFSDADRQRLYRRFIDAPVSATLADPIGALRVHHVRDGDEVLYLCWANLMLGRPVDRDYLIEASDARISLLPLSAREHRLPYRDFVFQYPPLAVAPILAAGAVTTDPVLYPYAFGILAGLAALVIAVAGWKARTHLAARASPQEYLRLSALGLFLVGVTLETRLDVFAAAAVALALWAALRDRWIAAGVLLGIGAGIKLYPALLLPAFVAPLLARRRYREATGCAAALSAVAGLWVLAGALIGAGGFGHVLELQSARQLHIESVAATAVAWAQLASGSALETVRAFGAIDLIAGPSAAIASICRVLVLAGALSGGLIAWMRTRTRSVSDDGPLIDGAAIAIAAIWIASPVLSPQYLVWGLPVFLFVRPAPRAVYLVALGLTRIVYPASYPWIAHLSVPGLALVSVRNALLVVCCALLVLHPLTRRPSDMASVRAA